MNVSEGDRAVIIFSIHPENIGRIVNVVEYIGEFTEREKFQFRGQPCMALITDHQWWIEAEDLKIGLGPSPRAYIADSWLRKIEKQKISSKQKESKELDVSA